MEGFPDPKYFDYAASSPPWEESIEAYVRTSQSYFGNPSSNHGPGKKAKQQLLGLKKEFCDLLHFFDGRLLLASSGTEVNNTIIEGHMAMFPLGKLLIAEDVHESIWYTTQKYNRSVKVLGIDSNGQLPLEKFKKALNKNISLVCMSHICNETGAMHPIKEIADICSRRQIRILIDGSQSIGHIPLNLNEIPFTYYSFSGHKFGSVRAAGGALIRDDQFRPLLHGGSQEWGLRSGTEDLAGLSSMVIALKKSASHLDSELVRLKGLKKVIVEELREIPGFVVNSPEDGFPGLLSISLPGFSGMEIVGAMSMQGYAISTGSACHESQMEPPRIIEAMGRSRKEAIGSVRISMGYGTTAQAVDELVEALLNIIR